MANVKEDDAKTIGECEATVIITPEQFFGNPHFEFGDWSQTKEKPVHIGGTADWAVYPTYHFNPTLENLERMVGVASHHGIFLGRNDEQKGYLRQFLDGDLVIADIGNFDASTKPVSTNALPYWWFVRSEKDHLGKSVSAKTTRLQSYEDIVRLQTASGALMTKILNAGEFGETVGVIQRIIVKYKLQVGECDGSPLYVPADMRVDKQYQLSQCNGCLNLSSPTYLTSVECELDEHANSKALQRGIDAVYDTLYDRGGLRTAIRFGRFSLAEDPKAHLKEDLQTSNPSLSDEAFTKLYDRMQDVGKQAFKAYERAPDSINRQVEPVDGNVMKQLQQVDGRF